MKLIEIKSLENGGHRNAAGDFKSIPEGWAVIPDGMETPNFPFGEIEIKETEGVMVVKKWKAGTMPKPEEVEKPISKFEQLRADIDYLALMTEVDL